MTQGVPGRLRPQIFLTFGTTRVVGHQPYAPAAFTPGEIPGTHFQRLSRPHGTWFCQELWKKSPVTLPGIDPETVRIAAQCLNHYANPGPIDMTALTHTFKQNMTEVLTNNRTSWKSMFCEFFVYLRITKILNVCNSSRRAEKK